MIAENYEGFLLALTLWREARGEDYDAKVGVGCVIRNRVRMAPAQGFRSNYLGNILKPYAFSSFNHNDPNATLFPMSTALPSWVECCKAAEAVMANCGDPTSGAVFYFSPPVEYPPKEWGNVIPTVKIGRLRFYKI